MVGVHDQHRLGLSPEGSVDQGAFFPGILDQALDGRRIRADHGDDPVPVDHVAEPDIDQFHSGPLLDVLDLFPDLLNFGFQFHHQPGDGHILAF